MHHVDRLTLADPLVAQQPDQYARLDLRIDEHVRPKVKEEISKVVIYQAMNVTQEEGTAPHVFLSKVIESLAVKRFLHGKAPPHVVDIHRARTGFRVCVITASISLVFIFEPCGDKVAADD